MKTSSNYANRKVSNDLRNKGHRVFIMGGLLTSPPIVDLSVIGQGLMGGQKKNLQDIATNQLIHGIRPWSYAAFFVLANHDVVIHSMYGRSNTSVTDEIAEDMVESEWNKLHTAYMLDGNTDLRPISWFWVSVPTADYDFDKNQQKYIGIARQLKYFDNEHCLEQIAIKEKEFKRM